MDVIWNTKPNQSPIIFKRDAKWQGISLLHHNVLSGELEEFIPDVHEFNITLAGSLRVEKKNASGGTTVRYSSKGNLCITPSGQPMKASWQRRLENLAIIFEPKFVEQIALENNFSTGFEVAEIYKKQDPLVQQLGLSLLDEIISDESTNQLYADSLSQSLVIHLLKHYTTAKFAEKTIKGGLSGYKLKLVTEYINDNLSDDLSLAEIAKVAGLSRYHFARAFRKTTGMTPQKYLMNQRIEKAKDLLSNEDLPIVEVSLQTGFKNQSHFTTLFRKITNLTPKNWRDLQHA